jgi:hypothetical protein
MPPGNTHRTDEIHLASIGGEEAVLDGDGLNAGHALRL